MVKVKVKTLHVESLTNNFRLGGTFHPLEVCMVTFIRELLAAQVILARLKTEKHGKGFLGVGRPLLCLFGELLRSKEKGLVDLRTVQVNKDLEQDDAYS